MADKNGLDRDSDELAQQFDRSAQMTASFSAELGRMQQSMLLTSREADSFANGVGGGLKRAFDGMIFDGMKLNDALKGIARGMAGLEDWKRESGMRRWTRVQDGRRIALSIETTPDSAAKGLRLELRVDVTEP